MRKREREREALYETVCCLHGGEKAPSAVSVIPRGGRREEYSCFLSIVRVYSNTTTDV